jgi:hypothetical protein
MNKKTKIIIAISIVVLVLLGIFLVIMNLNKSEKEPVIINEDPEIDTQLEIETQPAPENTQVPANEEEPTVYRFDEEEEAQREVTKEDLKQLAFAISERFGSYSNEGNFGNISDLKIYMTDSMKSWAEGYVEEQSETEYTGSYYGITTTSLVGEVTEFDEESASVTVTTKRREIKDNEESIFNQDIIINFNKVGNEYKIDAIYWQ